MGKLSRYDFNFQDTKIPMIEPYVYRTVDDFNFFGSSYKVGHEKPSSEIWNEANEISREQMTSRLWQAKDWQGPPDSGIFIDGFRVSRRCTWRSRWG